jgi:hypothetical protein
MCESINFDGKVRWLSATSVGKIILKNSQTKKKSGKKATEMS